MSVPLSHNRRKIPLRPAAAVDSSRSSPTFAIQTDWVTFSSTFQIQTSAHMFVSITAELISDVSGVSPRDFSRLLSLDLHLRDDGSDSGSDQLTVLPNGNLPKIRKIEKLSLVPNLKQLNLSYNMISRIEGLDALSHLVELNLAENRIQKIENLESLIQLERLNLSGNEIERIPSSIAQLVNLSHLRIARNKLNVLQDLQHLSSLEKLTNLRLDDNPIATTEKYDLFAIFFIPSLVFLDGLEISDRRRNLARSAFATDHAQHLRHRLASEQHRLVRLRDEIEKEVGTNDSIRQEVLESKSLALKLDETRAIEQTIAALQQRLSSLTPASSRNISLPYFSSPDSEVPQTDQNDRLRSAAFTPARDRSREGLAERQIVDLNEKVEKLTSRFMSSEKEKGELQSKLKEHQDSQHLADDLKRELRDVERDLEQALEVAHSCTAESTALKEELKQVSLALTDKDALLVVKDKRIAELEEELRKSRQDTLEYQRIARELRERPTFVHSTTSAASDYEAQEARVRSLSQRLDHDELERQTERMQREVDDCRLQATSLNDALLRSRENYDALKQKMASLEKKLLERDGALLAHERENISLQQSTERLRVENRSLEKEKQAMQARIETLENDFRCVMKAQRSTPQKHKKYISLSVSNGLTTPSERRISSHYLDVDSTDSEERDASPLRRVDTHSPHLFVGSQLDKSGAEIIAHLMLEELREQHVLSINQDVKEACIRAALRLIQTSSAVEKQVQNDSDQHREIQVELIPFHVLGNRDFLSRFVAEAHAGLAVLEDAVEAKAEIQQLQKMYSELESKISFSAQALSEKEKAVKMLEKHAEEARRQAQVTLEDLEALHKKLQTARDEVVRADAERTMALRELDIARHSLKECLALSDVENKNVVQLRERISQLTQEQNIAETALLQTRDHQTKEEHKLRTIKQTISEEIRLMQFDINKLQQEFRSKKLHLEDYDKQRKLQDEENDIRKRELDAYLNMKTREVEDEMRQLNTIRNDIRITKLESETALSRKKQIEYELAQLQERLHSESARCVAEDVEARKRLEQADKRTTDTERFYKSLRDKHMLLESEHKLLQQAVDDLKRIHMDLEKSAEKKKKTADDEHAQVEHQVQIAFRNYRQLVAQIEHKQHDHDTILAELRAVERKAEDVKRSSREVQSKHDHLKDEVHFLTQEKEKLHKDVQQLKKSEEDLRQQLFLLRTSLEHENKVGEEIRRKISLLQNEDLSLHESEQKMKSALQGLKKQIEENNANLDSMCASADRERRQIQELSTKRSLLEKEVFQLEERARVSRERKHEESARQQDLDHQMVKSIDEMNRIAKQVIEFEQKIDSLQRRESELKGQEQSIQSQISKLQLEHEGLRSRISSEKNNFQRLLDEGTRASNSIRDKQHDLENLDAAVQSRRQELDIFKLEVQHLENVKLQIEKEVTRYQAHNQIELKRLETTEEAYKQVEKQLQALRSEFLATEDAYEKTRSLSLEESRKVEQQRKAWQSTMQELERLEGSIENANQNLEMQRSRALDEISRLDQAKRSAQSQMFLMSEGKKRLGSKPTTEAAISMPLPIPVVLQKRTNHALMTYPALDKAANSTTRGTRMSTTYSSPSDDESISSSSTSFQLSSLQKAVENLRVQSSNALLKTDDGCQK